MDELSEARLLQYIGNAEKLKEDCRYRITALLGNLIQKYADRKTAIGELYQGNDVHLYLSLARSNNQHVLHIQAYPGMSSATGFRFKSRVMYRPLIERCRRSGHSIGNEHAAVIEEGPSFMNEEFRYDADHLMEVLEQANFDQ